MPAALFQFEGEANDQKDDNNRPQQESTWLEGYIPSPFSNCTDSGRDQTLERLDEAHFTKNEAISEDHPDDGDADDPGQA